MCVYNYFQISDLHVCAPSKIGMGNIDIYNLTTCSTSFQGKCTGQYHQPGERANRRPGELVLQDLMAQSRDMNWYVMYRLLPVVPQEPKTVP